MKKNILWVTLCAFYLVSCSSSDADPNNSSTGVLVNTMVIDASNVSEDDFNLQFLYNGNKLISVKDSGIVIEQFTYSDGKLTKINYPADGYYILVEYNANNQVVKFTEIDEEFNEAVKTLVTYSGSTFTKTSYSGDLITQDFLEQTETYTIATGNIVQIETISFGFTDTTTFDFDTKNNPFKNISNYDVFQILDLDIDGNSNNVVSSNYTNNINTISISYNSNNYPEIEQTFSSSGELKETTTYTYN